MFPSLEHQQTLWLSGQGVLIYVSDKTNRYILNNTSSHMSQSRKKNVERNESDTYLNLSRAYKHASLF